MNRFVSRPFGIHMQCPNTQICANSFHEKADPSQAGFAVSVEWSYLEPFRLCRHPILRTGIGPGLRRSHLNAAVEWPLRLPPCSCSAMVHKFPADPQLVQQHGRLSSDGNHRAFLGVASSALAVFQSPSPRIAILSERSQDVVPALHHQSSWVAISFLADVYLGLAAARVPASRMQPQIKTHVAAPAKPVWIAHRQHVSQRDQCAHTFDLLRVCRGLAARGIITEVVPNEFISAGIVGPRCDKQLLFCTLDTLALRPRRERRARWGEDSLQTRESGLRRSERRFSSNCGKLQPTAEEVPAAAFQA